jgi:hypothetical protein
VLTPVVPSPDHCEGKKSEGKVSEHEPVVERPWLQADCCPCVVKGVNRVTSVSLLRGESPVRWVGRTSAVKKSSSSSSKTVSSLSANGNPERRQPAPSGAPPKGVGG